MNKARALPYHADRRRLMVKTVHLFARQYLRRRASKIDRSLDKVFGVMRSFSYNPWRGS